MTERKSQKEKEKKCKINTTKPGQRDVEFGEEAIET